MDGRTGDTAGRGIGEEEWERAFRALAARTPLPAPPPGVADELERLFRQRVAEADLRTVRALLTWDSAADAELAGARAVAAALPRATRHLVYDADGIDLTFDLHGRPDGTLRVAGQVLPPPGVVQPVSTLRLVRERRAVAEAPIDDLGEFALPRVVPGRYAAVLIGGSLRIDLAIDLALVRGGDDPR